MVWEASCELLPLTPELAFRFCTYWGIVAHRRRQAPDVRYPFYHLKSDGCWAPLDENGKPVDDLSRYGYRAAGVPGTVMGLDRAATEYGRLPRAASLAPAIALAPSLPPTGRLPTRGAAPPP